MNFWDLLEELKKSTDNGDVCKSNTLANEKSALAKDNVQGSEDARNVVLGLLVRDLVELDNTQGGVHPAARSGVDLKDSAHNMRN